MKYGFITSWGSISDYVTMAQEAEEYGWDGIFVWDDIAVGSRGVFDPWVALGAMAAVTDTIILGAMVFSLARRRPWKVARETLTLDNLSNGRLVIPVGLGGTWDGGYARVNTEDPALRVRAERLDECLDILQLAWTGEVVSYQGKHYQMEDLQFQPPPLQQPRIPIWPVGAWPYAKSMGRAAELDGIVAYDKSDGAPDHITADAVTNIQLWLEDNRDSTGPFDIITEGETTGTDQDQALLEPLAEAGATWFIESRWEEHESADTLLERIRQGPPQV